MLLDAYELFVCMFSFCMNFMLNLMYVIRYRLCFVLDCVFFYKLNADCVFSPAVTDELILVCPLLLWTQIVMGK
jgi:hypothetical protein